MARSKKPQVVDKIKHTSGIVIEIKLDRITLDFIADMPDGSEIRDKVANNVKSAVWKWLKENSVPNWQPIIEVKRLKPFAVNDGPFVGFSSNRFYYSVDSSGVLTRSNWGLGPNVDWGYAKRFHAEADSGFPKSSETTIYLPYSEELWVGIMELERAIIILRDRLDNMIRNDPSRISAAGEKLLRLLPRGDDK